jgi:hypothetical protein
MVYTILESQGHPHMGLILNEYLFSFQKVLTERNPFRRAPKADIRVLGVFKTELLFGGLAAIVGSPHIFPREYVPRLRVYTRGSDIRNDSLIFVRNRCMGGNDSIRGWVCLR